MEERKITRLKKLLGVKAIEKLNKKKVAVFGLGGVGGYVVEGLVRSGIENFIIVDNDIVDISNFNRQIIATNENIGRYKVDVTKSHILNINENANVETIKKFIVKGSLDSIDLSNVDYVVDAIDTITGKIEIIKCCKNHNIKIISAMGCGNKLRGEMVKIADLSETKICRLAKVMRHELKKYNIYNLKVAYSEEVPIVDTSENIENSDIESNTLQKSHNEIKNDDELKSNDEMKINENNVANEKSIKDIDDICTIKNDNDIINKKKNPPSSIIFVPAMAGLLIAETIIYDLLEE